MATTGPFPITNFQNADGTPIANGTLRIRLSQDEQNTSSTGPSQLSNTFVDFPLDANGNSGTITLPLSSGFILFPILSYYIYEVYNSNGLKVAGPNLIKVV